jgi:hypothetical protein
MLYESFRSRLPSRRIADGSPGCGPGCRSHMGGSSLCDGRVFARKIERVYQSIVPQMVHD